MGIKQKIENDFKTALKEKDKITISALRMLKSTIHNKEIEYKYRGRKLEDGDIINIIIKQVQQHRDSIEQFMKGQRQDLVEKEKAETEILKKYLPKQLSAEEITDEVRKIIAEIKKTGEDLEFGKVMKLAMAELKGKAEGKLINQIVSNLLGKAR
jgi:hypothetical protein